MFQHTDADGVIAQERSSAVNDKLQVVQYNPEYSKDEWIQAALTIEGKLGSWDLVAAGGGLWRDGRGGPGLLRLRLLLRRALWLRRLLLRQQLTLRQPQPVYPGRGRLSSLVRRGRVSSPAENRWRVIAGLFAQRQDT
jgi:hypothetical protein